MNTSVKDRDKDIIDAEIVEELPNLKKEAKEQKQKKTKVPPTADFKKIQRKQRLENIGRLVLKSLKVVGATLITIGAMLILTANRAIAWLGFPIIAGLVSFIVVTALIGGTIANPVWWALGITAALVCVNNLVAMLVAEL